MTDKTKSERPSLEELASKPISEAVEFFPDMSISELLIIGAAPLNRNPRPIKDIIALSGIVQDKINQLETDKNRIAKKLADNFIPKSTHMLRTDQISSYFEKYLFLISEVITNDNCQFNQKVKKNIKDFKPIILKAGRNPEKINSEDELENLKTTKTNLKYIYCPRKSDQDLVLIGMKLKVPERIASKITYYMLLQHRKDNNGRKIDGKSDLKGISLDAIPIVKDIAGVQIVLNVSPERLNDYVNRTVLTSGLIKAGETKNYYNNNSGPYKAFHVPVFLDQNNTYQYKEHCFRDPVEIIIMELNKFVEANFDPQQSYWRRINLQKRGIASKDIHNGMLNIDKFTDYELKWKSMIDNRLMEILTYRKAPLHR